MWIVDIDVGGTLTDGIFTSGEQAFSAKVDTTPHDLTVCLFDCLAQGATKLGFADTPEFLEHIDLIRWSTTITSNVLAELRGPRIGLLVSKNHEKDLYGSERSSILNRLLADKDVIGLNGSFDSTQVTNAARALLEGGVRRICVSLKDSHRNPAAELEVKSAIDLQYPDHFLGSVPVLAGSDISKSSDDRTRTYCAVINAYTHGALAATLFKAEDELRQSSQYAGTFLVSHINGGVAGIAKTKAIDTIESGPILGIHASVFFAQLYGLKDVVAMDIGGTTAKISVLKNGQPINRKPSDFFGIPVEISLPDLRSIALGGGSVVKPSGAGNSQIELGPESMGSFPGPACYALGGDQPTLTDAFVIAGLINPEFFLGGAKPLDRDLAQSVIENQVAKPMNISVDEACRLIIERAFELVADLIAAAAKDLKQDLSKHTLFAYGGNGSLFACGVAEKTGIKNVQLFALGPVFSAFGSSVSDICHVYERSLAHIATSDENAGSLQAILKEIKTEGTKDLLGEGIKPEGLTYEIEIEASGSAGNSIVIPCSESILANPKTLRDALASASGSAANISAKDISLELMRVRVKKPMSKPQVAERALKSENSAHARTGMRKILGGSSNGDAQVYRWEALEPGNRVAGPAILEEINTTHFVPEGWTMFLDRFGNGALTKR